MVLTILASVWSVVFLVVTVLRVLLIPLALLCAVGFCLVSIPFIAFGSLPLAMSTLVMPLLPLVVLLIGVFLLIGAITSEILPICIGIGGLVLSILSVCIGNKKASRRVLRGALTLPFAIAGLALEVYESFWLTLPALVAVIPAVIFAVFSGVFLVQMFTLGSAA